MNNTRPWYRSPELWLVLSPLMVSVVAGIAMVFIASGHRGSDALPGEFDRQGRIIALDPAASARSVQLAAGASGVIDSQAGQLWLQLAQPLAAPSLEARLVHATLADRDVTVVLHREGERYLGRLPAAWPDRGEWHVYPADFSWRLVAPLQADRELRFSPSRRDR